MKKSIVRVATQGMYLLNLFNMSETDYFSFYSKRCSRCHHIFWRDDWIMSVDDDQVFHVECFQCVACHHVLAPGQMFGMYEGLIYCHRDYQHIINYWRHSSDDTATNHQTTTHETVADTLENKEITEQATEKSRKKSRSKSKNVLTKEQLNILKTCYMSVLYLIFMLLSLNIQVQPETLHHVVQPVDGDDWSQLALPQSLVPE